MTQQTVIRSVRWTISTCVHTVTSKRVHNVTTEAGAQKCMIIRTSLELKLLSQLSFQGQCALKQNKKYARGFSH